jgi:MATE family multidrug resistance protein
MGIAMNLSGLIWMYIGGLSLACSARVANSLGAGLPRAAARATFTALALGVGVDLLCAALAVPLRHRVALLFTDAPAAVAGVAALMPVFAASLPGDGANAVLQGLLRGAGKQAAGAVTNVISYWLFGLPAAYYLAFRRGMGLRGLWAGIAAVNTLQGAVMLAIAVRFDFAAEAKKATERSSGLLAPLVEGGEEGSRDGETGDLLPEP